MSFLKKVFGQNQSANVQAEKIHMSVITSGGHAVATLAIPRSSVEHPSETTRDELNKLVDEIATLCVKDGTIIKISPTIDGFNKDKRELFEIPEVCAWARDTLDQLPALFHFLTKASQDYFVVWSCGPMSRKDLASPKYQGLFAEKQARCNLAAWGAFTELLKKVGAEDFQITMLRVDLMHKVNE
jgi:hypothetical protein